MKKRSQGGHAAVEVALMAPWIFLLFVAVLDFGFYAYAGIATADAARVAALHTSAGAGSAADSQAACEYVLAELRNMPNLGSAACSCAGAGCIAGPATVSAIALDGVDSIAGQPPVPASQVTVTYTTPQLFPLPWMLGQMTFTRITQMRVREE